MFGGFPDQEGKGAGDEDHENPRPIANVFYKLWFDSVPAEMATNFQSDKIPLKPFRVSMLESQSLNLDACSEGGAQGMPSSNVR
jgi:hypothetical protein